MTDAEATNSSEPDDEGEPLPPGSVRLANGRVLDAAMVARISRSRNQPKDHSTRNIILGFFGVCIALFDVVILQSGRQWSTSTSATSIPKATTAGDIRYIVAWIVLIVIVFLIVRALVRFVRNSE
jgi:hypothetical protein